MSTRLDVLFAVKDLVAFALPGAEVAGVDSDDATPARIPDAGRAVVRAGEPGDAEMILSPRSWWYDHRIPIELMAYRDGGSSAEQAIDAMLVAVGEAVAADRTLGGRCSWIGIEPGETSDIYVVDTTGVMTGFTGARPPRGVTITLVATYGAANELG